MKRAVTQKSYWLGLLAIGALVPAVALADGGAIVARQNMAGLEITVFASPSPWVAGPIDLSFLVQDVGSGRVAESAQLSVTLTAHDGSSTVQVTPAQSAAQNKLLQACSVELLPGIYDVTLDCQDARGATPMTFAMTVGEPPSGWQGWWHWFAWPVVPAVIYMACQLGDERHRAKRIQSRLAAREQA